MAGPPAKCRVDAGRAYFGQLGTVECEPAASAIFIAIHNAACALAVARQFVDAERLFRIFLQEHQKELTAYSQALFLLECWQNRRNPDEIRDLLSGFQNVTLGQVLRFAPELAEAVGV